jgi:multidrug transporter EmrE-like cation transporter
MKNRFDLAGHVYIFLTLMFTVFGQLVLKWQMSKVGPMPGAPTEKIGFLLHQFLQPWVLGAFVCAFFASLAWMAAMTRFELNYAYPFMSLAFVVVMLFSVVFLGEALNLRRVVGTVLVIGGLVVIARG